MNIVLDVDDVLAGTVGALEDHFGPAADLSVEDLTVMFPGADLETVLDDAAFHLGIPQVHGAREGVQRLLDHGHEISLATSRPAGLREATLAWLRTGGFPELRLHCDGRESKLKILGSWTYDLLIDDQVRYLSVARERQHETIAFTYPWNAAWRGHKVESWLEVGPLVLTFET